MWVHAGGCDMLTNTGSTVRMWRNNIMTINVMGYVPFWVYACRMLTGKAMWALSAGLWISTFHDKAIFSNVIWIMTIACVMRISHLSCASLDQKKLELKAVEQQTGDVAQFSVFFQRLYRTWRGVTVSHAYSPKSCCMMLWFSEGFQVRKAHENTPRHASGGAHQSQSDQSADASM